MVNLFVTGDGGVVIQTCGKNTEFDHKNTWGIFGIVSEVMTERGNPSLPQSLEMDKKAKASVTTNVESYTISTKALWKHKQMGFKYASDPVSCAAASHMSTLSYWATSCTDAQVLFLLSNTGRLARHGSTNKQNRKILFPE